jgi:hypothetical protein
LEIGDLLALTELQVCSLLLYEIIDVICNFNQNFSSRNPGEFNQTTITALRVTYSLIHPFQPLPIEFKDARASGVSKPSFKNNLKHPRGFQQIYRTLGFESGEEEGWRA